VAELAGWAPVAWRAALRWTAHLADLAAVAHLWTQPPLRWMQTDPVLARYAAPATPGSRRASLITGSLAPLGRGLLTEAAAVERRGHSPRRAAAADPAPLPAVARAWIAHWRTLWPQGAGSAAQHAALDALCAAVLAHRGRFAQLPPGDTTAAREAFAARVLARLRADPTQPVALFAYLALLALDLERLRAECLAQAFDTTVAARARREAA
jgi:hypothetical protein